MAYGDIKNKLEQLLLIKYYMTKYFTLQRIRNNMDIKKDFLCLFTNILRKKSSRSSAATLADTADTATITLEHQIADDLHKSIIVKFQKRENMFIFC